MGVFGSLLIGMGVPLTTMSWQYLNCPSSDITTVRIPSTLEIRGESITPCMAFSAVDSDWSNPVCSILPILEMVNVGTLAGNRP